MAPKYVSGQDLLTICLTIQTAKARDKASVRGNEQHWLKEREGEKNPTGKGSCRASKKLRLESNCVKSEQSPLASLGLKLHLTAVERRRISPDSSRALSLYTFKNMAPQSHYPRLWRCKASDSTSHSTAQRGCVASPRSVQNPKKIKKLKKSNK